MLNAFIWHQTTREGLEKVKLHHNNKTTYHCFNMCEITELKRKKTQIFIKFLFIFVVMCHLCNQFKIANNSLSMTCWNWIQVEVEWSYVMLGNQEEPDSHSALTRSNPVPVMVDKFRNSKSKPVCLFVCVLDLNLGHLWYWWATAKVPEY